MIDFDIVIVGGGLVGASLACALRDQPVKIAIIDHIEPNFSCKKTSMRLGSKQNLEGRALALSHTSIICLKTLGVWDDLSHYASPILTVHASKKGYLGQTQINASSQDLPELGWVVSSDNLSTALYQYLDKSSQPKNQVHEAIQFYAPQSIVKLEKQDKNKESFWSVTLNSGKILTAKLLVGADGVGSYVRQHHGIGINTVDYQQIAIVSNIEIKKSHQQVAYERFLNEGAIAMLPFGDRCVKSVWITKTKEAEQLLALSEVAYVEQLQEHFGYRLGYLKRTGKRWQYPLRMAYSESIYGNGFVLIGNAANTLTPIAAQGYNLALRDVAVLAEKIVIAKQLQKDIGSIEVLASYATARHVDHQTIRQLTDKLSTSKILQWLGIMATEWLPPMRNRLVMYGLGRQQKLPKLCRGINL